MTRRTFALRAGLRDVFLRAKPIPTGMIHALIAGASLAVSGCATQQYVRSVTYEYTDRTRLAAEQGARQDIQDACYFSGAQYPWLVGPPRIVSEGGTTGKSFRATQSFYCIGTRGES